MPSDSELLKRRRGESVGNAKRMKFENNPASITKQLLPRSCTFYSANSNELRFLPLNNIIGCSELATILQLRIGEPLANPDNYEITDKGRAVVERFLHFNGCKKNSFSTYLKSFCQEKHINLFDITRAHLFDPNANDFDAIYQMARRNQPAIVYIANHDEFLISSNPTNAKLLSTFTRQCKKIRSNRHSVWTILRTSIPSFEAHNPLNWDFYEYFDSSHRTVPLQTDADVCTIFKDRLQYHLPDNRFTGDDILAFANNYMRHCTYFQIDSFVRRVILENQNKMTPVQRRINPQPDIAALITFSFYVSSLTLPNGDVTQSIMPYSPLHQNHSQFRVKQY